MGWAFSDSLRPPQTATLTDELYGVVIDTKSTAITGLDLKCAEVPSFLMDLAHHFEMQSPELASLLRSCVEQHEELQRATRVLAGMPFDSFIKVWMKTMESSERLAAERRWQRDDAICKWNRAEEKVKELQAELLMLRAMESAKGQK